MSKYAAYPQPWNLIIPFCIRVFVWSLFFLVLFVLRSFFLLIFLTFVFAYIQNTGVEKLSSRIPSRTLRVVIVGVCLLTVLTLVGLYLTPRVRDQAEKFAQGFSTHVEDLDLALRSLATNYPMVGEMAPFLHEPDAEETSGNVNGTAAPSGKFLIKLLGYGEIEEGKENVRHLLESLRNFGVKLLGIGSAFLLSLLFSFLIVLDLPRLSAAVRELRNTRITFVYQEMAQSLFTFGTVMGQALQAQLLISCVNTILTALGVYLLGISPNIAFISVIVFFCGFIPVAGVFISSVPICLFALQEGGIVLALGAALLIWIIHMIEAYILNPKIYGHHLRINPVIVLIILTLGGKLFGFWGLVLGLPVCTYIFRYAIR